MGIEWRPSRAGRRLEQRAAYRSLLLARRWSRLTRQLSHHWTSWLPAVRLAIFRQEPLRAGPDRPAGPVPIRIAPPAAPARPAFRLSLTTRTAVVTRLRSSSFERIERQIPPGPRMEAVLHAVAPSNPIEALSPRGSAAPPGVQLVVRTAAAAQQARPDLPQAIGPESPRGERGATAAQAPAGPAPPSIDEITTQVIRRIERRAIAQRERLARP